MGPAHWSALKPSCIRLWSIGAEQLVDVTVSGEQELSGTFPLCHRSNFATYRNLVRLECIQNLVLSGKDFFGEEKLGQLLHWDIRLGSLLCQKFWSLRTGRLKALYLWRRHCNWLSPGKFGRSRTFWEWNSLQKKVESGVIKWRRDFGPRSISY